VTPPDTHSENAVTYFWCATHGIPHEKANTTDRCLLVGPYFTWNEAVEWGTNAAPSFASLRRTSPLDKARHAVEGREWFRIVNRVDAAAGSTFAEVYLYDEIGFYGVSAGQFVAELGALDVDEIDLHVNSPGGEVWDGIAIYNALVNHRASINAYTDGIAASAASVIVMAGDTRVMAKGSQLMIHDAWGLCVGNAAEMAAMATRLDQESDNIAGIYSSRAGGTVKQWRKAMVEETWYNAEEAVAAGLADKVSAPARTGDDTAVAARWDLSVYGYKHAGRDDAPAPTTGRADRPAAVATTPPPDPDPVDPEPIAAESLEVDDTTAADDALANALASFRPAPPDDELDDFELDIAASIQRAANDAPWPTPPAPAEDPDLSDADIGDQLATSIRKAFT
jgi:ATP-dependent protease ClpP protease subunit